MIIRRLLLVIGAILIIVGVLLIATGFPLSIIGPLVLAVGLILILLSIFHGGKFLLGITSILLGVLLVIAAAAIFAILGPAFLEAYVLLFLGITLIILGIILLACTC